MGLLNVNFRLHFIFQKVFPQNNSQQSSSSSLSSSLTEHLKQESTLSSLSTQLEGVRIDNKSEANKEAFVQQSLKMGSNESNFKILNIGFVDRDSAISYYRLYPNLYLPNLK